MVSEAAWELKGDWSGSASLFLLTPHLLCSPANLITGLSGGCYCGLKGMSAFSGN